MSYGQERLKHSPLDSILKEYKRAYQMEDDSLKDLTDKPDQEEININKEANDIVLPTLNSSINDILG